MLVQAGSRWDECAAGRGWVVILMRQDGCARRSTRVTKSGATEDRRGQSGKDAVTRGGCGGWMGVDVVRVAGRAPVQSCWRSRLVDVQIARVAPRRCPAGFAPQGCVARRAQPRPHPHLPRSQPIFSLSPRHFQLPTDPHRGAPVKPFYAAWAGSSAVVAAKAPRSAALRCAPSDVFTLFVGYRSKRA